MEPSQSQWESFKLEGTAILDKLKELLHEGNVRRVVIEHDGRTVAEFPLTVGLVGAVFAPVLAAVGALVAVIQQCTIHVERESRRSDDTTPGPDVPPGVA